ncbi:pyridoxal phosphate-dependent aminotransferase [Burkholderia multivorans]|uniref:pyridoxal phosphate-dependent aminotransferase n=1 Tax=Burkholderia multivorans TaxID=87883 RepID=UPI000D007D46|nr:pyridoxal phosphate-dependent aminotransferase [Burkholderia multivorans]MBR8244032.1 pyridoxal phosphate-dependent aminotransferase [Burkholderia multivorans]MDN7946868.1 pyridoxal phosphate-dependent aminotransferase [Burkholderia multivorans]MDR9174405.1 Methionine aminotransferase [Burkholderia multivorans]MDR9182946.1 Methionine aminotransferase [Burkholderia multivorans]MDR9188786.1 Methionine aminotransferase [Burkholderia multivorans]
MNAPSDMPTSPVFPSRLPNVGTTIFTVMSALAAEKGAVNLGQGFPDFDCDPRIVDAVAAAMRSGHNQYPPMAGVAPLREAIADKIAQLYGRRYDASTEITVTAGATQALLTAILCAVHPGDEVIVVEPTYDSYLPSIELAGGKPVFVTLEAPDYTIPFDRLAAAITPNTRMILINTPHNPTGTVWREADMRKLEDIVRGTNVLILSDEVYEHMVYDGERHESVARYPELAARSFIVSSFGKTYHVTGWKVGYVAAPAALTAEFRKVHQFNVFTVNTPMQIGLADYLRDPAPYLTLAGFYQNKRDFFRAGLERTRFQLLPCSGTYFQCVDYSAISDLPEAEFSKWLTSEIGVAAIPVSAFYHEPHESGVVRFCFAKQESTLATALERLARL